MAVSNRNTGNGRRRGVALPLLIVISGVLLLFNNFGLLDRNWFGWLNFELLWPVLLIVGGSTLIWRRTRGGL